MWVPASPSSIEDNEKADIRAKNTISSTTTNNISLITFKDIKRIIKLNTIQSKQIL